MTIRFVAITIISPIFILLGALIAIVGGACGQIYIKAQLSVKVLSSIIDCLCIHCVQERDEQQEGSGDGAVSGIL
jgi:hypothetical protein